jgi:hypothetical protein
MPGRQASSAANKLLQIEKFVDGVVSLTFELATFFYIRIYLQRINE